MSQKDSSRSAFAGRQRSFFRLRNSGSGLRCFSRHSSLVACHCLSLVLITPVSLRAILCAAPQQSSAQASSEAQETQALQDAVRSAEDNPQVLIKNLGSFLKRFPDSVRREQVIEAIYKSAFRANDPQTAIEYGESLLELRPDDPVLLSSLVEVLDREGDASNRAKALQHATHLVELAERQYQESGQPAPGREKSTDSLALMVAQACLTRGKLYAEAGNLEKAEADYDKSYAVYPSPQVA